MSKEIYNTTIKRTQTFKRYYVQGVTLLKCFFLPISIIAFLSACNKQDSWLDKKKNNFDVVPSELADFQALLDNTDVMNLNYSAFGILGADNFFLLSSDYNASSNVQFKNPYIWAKDIYESSTDFNWSAFYSRIAYANAVLDGIEKIKKTPGNTNAWNNAKGIALFIRAYQFYNLIQLWAKPYNSSTSPSDLGIPLKLSSDVNEPSVRNNVQQVYDQIIADLKEAILLLPSVQSYKTRPSGAAANGLLARVFLSMEKYSDASLYAAAALNSYNFLYDLNAPPKPLSSAFPFPTYQEGNEEVVFYAEIGGNALIRSPALRVDSLLYQSYADNDLRKKAFFSSNGSTMNFKGQYTGQRNQFAGISTNEFYLIRSESNARQGNLDSAMKDLNYLLSKRFAQGTFVPLIANNVDDALNKILTERRKELPFTGGLRWEDLRRLNKDTRFAITLYRIINGQTYTLPSNDKRYLYPIPQTEITLSNLDQNPR